MLDVVLLPESAAVVLAVYQKFPATGFPRPNSATKPVRSKLMTGVDVLSTADAAPTEKFSGWANSKRIYLQTTDNLSALSFSRRQSLTTGTFSCLTGEGRL